MRGNLFYSDILPCIGQTIQIFRNGILQVQSPFSTNCIMATPVKDLVIELMLKLFHYQRQLNPQCLPDHDLFFTILLFLITANCKTNNPVFSIRFLLHHQLCRLVNK
jgi:hypothetical protein